MPNWSLISPRIFLLTPLREGRQIDFGLTETYENISTHAPAGGATRGRKLCAGKVHHFYSRPCGRGDPPSMGLLVTWLISTHAPAGGATFYWAKEEA